MEKKRAKNQRHFRQAAGGAIITLNGTTFQASYESIDGKDVTLPVQ